MKKIEKMFLLIAVILTVTDCQQKEKYAVENYIKQEDINTSIEPLFPYVMKLESGVNYDNRFDSSHKNYFLEQQRKYKFSFERYYVTNDSVHYFLLWKIAPSLYEKKIAIGGRYKKNAQGKITDFEEIFNTPKMKQVELKEKSFMLFEYMVENGNVEPYLADFELVEFPDGLCEYDKEKHKWILTGNPRWASKNK